MEDNIKDAILDEIQIDFGGDGADLEELAIQVGWDTDDPYYESLQNIISEALDGAGIDPQVDPDTDKEGEQMINTAVAIATKKIKEAKGN